MVTVIQQQSVFLALDFEDVLDFLQGGHLHFFLRNGNRNLFPNNTTDEPLSKQ